MCIYIYKCIHSINIYTWLYIYIYIHSYIYIYKLEPQLGTHIIYILVAGLYLGNLKHKYYITFINNNINIYIHI